MIINIYGVVVLNPKWLTTFVALVDIGHFTQTADKLCMTQPGVSQHISKLEQVCGHQLIIREKKSIELTERGRLVYDYAKKLLVNEHELFEQLAFDNPFSGHCRIACSGALALQLYPKLLSMQVLHPKLIIELKAAPNSQILNEIQSGNIDLGIITSKTNNGLYTIQELGREQLCLVLPASNKNKSAEDRLHHLGLINHPDAMHYLSLYVAQSTGAELNQLNIEQIPITGFVNQISQILEPVANGLGFTVLPKSVIESFRDLSLLSILKSSSPAMETLYTVQKRHRVLPKRFEAIKRMLHGHFKRN